MIHGVEYPFGQFRSAVPATFPPKFLPTPSLLARGGPWGKREGLDVRALFSNGQNVGLLPSSGIVTNPKHRTTQAAVEKGNSFPARPRMVIHFLKNS